MENISSSPRLAAIGRYTFSKRDQGINRFRTIMDTDHSKSVSYLIRYMLHKASVLSPGRRIELSVPIWMSDVISESEEAGFKRRLEYIRMGLYV